ncbi:MAG: hypothetical protein IVW57_18320 [Ktedonobacterales bacterium]|nr:hypothetical protein [Ktedonobacterales bacterium]
MAWDQDPAARLEGSAHDARGPDDPAPAAADFNAQYGALVKDVFTRIVNDALARGEHPEAQARVYASLGKPDFTLAYLVAGTLPDGEKRDLLAAAYERRATYTEEKAREFDRRFHRPFPLLFTGATRDRMTARRIRAGQGIRPEPGSAAQ